MAAHYDDPKYSYLDYWQGRDYEHYSETTAIQYLLQRKKFNQVADIGGGYGRLTPMLQYYSRKILLIEPSNKLRSQASKYLCQHKNIKILPGTAQKTRLTNSSQDLVMIVRVMHHLPDPTAVFAEVHRILKPNGLFLMEFANSHHLKARIQSIITGQPILPIPIEKRSLINIKRRTIPFVNHSPSTISKLLHKSGFEIISQLSVSNFRSPIIKRLIPQSLLLFLEKHLQLRLGRFHFGPSIFLLAKKTNP